jgi:GNAT superfamily N-acetyltransferase
MAEGIRIRPARVEDVPHILACIRGIAEYEKLADEVEATEASVRESFFGARPAAEALVAERDGVKVGFAVYFQTYSTFTSRPGMWLEDVFVQPESRGHGIGEAVLRELGRICVERGYPRLEWTVLDWNEPALKFYAKLGARPMEEWTTQRMAGPALAALAAGEAVA